MGENDYYLTSNDYFVGPSFYCSLLSLISYYPSLSDESMVSMVFEVDTNVRKTIDVPKINPILLQIRQRHPQLLQSNESKSNEFNESQSIQSNESSVVKDLDITGMMTDGDFHLWFNRSVGAQRISIPFASLERVVQMIDSFLFDKYRAFESRLIDLSSQSQKMGLSLLPGNNKRIKLTLIDNQSFAFAINKQQLLHIRDLINVALTSNQYP